MPMVETFKEIELKRIRPSRLNPRLEVNIERLNELATSIREVGLLEPIIVRPVNGEFEVVVGERRYRASQQAGLEKVPAIVREYADAEVVQLNLIENVQREELSAIEKGKVCKYLLEECPDKYPSQRAIAEKIGVSPEAVSTWLRTAEVVPEEAQTYVAPSTISGEVPEGKIDYQTAVKVGRSIQEPEKRVEVIKKLAEKRLPVKDRSQVIERVVLEPEKSVEEIIEEVAESPCTLHFAAEDKKIIAEGVKTQTSMTEVPDQKVKVGAFVHAAIWEPHIADLRITSVERKKLKYFNEEDAIREGGYSLAQFKRRWKEINGQWDDDQLVYIIRFEKTK
jgi:ParB family chromosome partitioning protein